MSAKKTPKQVKKFYQKHIAKMVHSFLLQTTGQPPDKVKEVYNSFSNSWENAVRKVNKRYGISVLSYDTWEKEIVTDGYMKIQTSIIPIEQKAELLRIIKICEGKTDKQWQRREAFYKILFIKMRVKYFFKNLIKKKAVA